MNNTIHTTSSKYRYGSRRHRICHCRRNALSILTNVLFIGEFLAKSNTKLSFPDNTYSEMSRSKFWLINKDLVATLIKSKRNEVARINMVQAQGEEMYFMVYLEYRNVTLSTGISHGLPAKSQCSYSLKTQER
jgi:hypothetical protein